MSHLFFTALVTGSNKGFNVLRRRTCIVDVCKQHEVIYSTACDSNQEQNTAGNLRMSSALAVKFARHICK